jgi:hypothetical protein
MEEKREIWTAKDELNEHTDHFDRVGENITRIILTINKYRSVRINRIDIYARNSIVELFKEYRDKGVDFSHSTIVRVVSTYFTILCAMALKNLKLYVHNLHLLIHFE